MEYPQSETKRNSERREKDLKRDPERKKEINKSKKK